jgi:starch synthase
LHDWPAALVPLVLRRAPGPDVPTVLTIHDVRRQGVFGARDLDSLGLGRDVYADEGVKLNSRVNVLKGGVLAADAVTTVSPAYAREMCSEAVAGPLATILSGLVRPVVGIANGIDYATNNPATDPLIVSRFDAEDASNKGRSKTALIRELGLELELSQPLLAVVGQATRENGFDLLAAALPSILKNPVTVVVGVKPPSQAGVVSKLEAAMDKHQDRARLIPDTDERLTHQIFAAADLVVVPTRHVPCGQQQLTAQRYGAVPIVYATGGHMDTVVDCDARLETGTGFMFDELSPKALTEAVERGLVAASRPEWGALRRRIMRLDLGWDRPARRYLQVYRQAIGAHA